jgi:hypothetical protein
LVKIGFTRFTIRREKQLRMLYPRSEFVFVFNGDLELEKSLHQRFHKQRVFGEWFDLTSADISNLEEELESQSDYEAIR